MDEALLYSLRVNGVRHNTRPLPMKELTKTSSVSLDVLAYTSLWVTVGVGTAAFLGSLAPFVELSFSVVALVTAGLLLWRKPALYIEFMWWVWFLTPEVRRLVDFRTGYTDSSLVMLAPYLVTGVALIAVLGRVHKLPSACRLPLAFVAVGLLYAYCVGVLNNGLVSATFDLLSWGAPVISGAYLLTHIRHSVMFRSATQRAFTWGLLLMGLYGLVQYFYVPGWDGYWMLNSGLNSIGYPLPLEVRVFSTLNAPGPFAIVVMAGLLLVFSERGVLRPLAAGGGFVGFALSAVRSAWGGWVLGFLIIAASLPSKLRNRLLGTFLLTTLVTVPFVTTGPVGNLLSQRLSTLTNLADDTSFNDRLALYGNFSSYIAGNPLGQGLGGTGVAAGLSSDDDSFLSVDSGFIAVFYTFGILGALYFLGGAAALFKLVFSSSLRLRGLTDAVYVGITAATLSQLVFNNTWSGVPGMVLWFFPALYLASHYATERTDFTVALERKFI